MRIWTLAVLLTVGAAASSAAAAATFASRGDRAADARAPSVVVSTHRVPGLGLVLANGKGLTLYMFVPDRRKRVTCVGTCARIWPPLKLAAKAKIVAKGGVKAKLLGSDRDPAGGRVVTYHGWPLYLYLGDRRPGVASGQALNLNGGLWYVLARSGALIKKKPAASTTSSSSSHSSTTPKTTSTTPTDPQSCGDDDGDGDVNSGGPDDGDGCI
jgi:predicted lipoprotein with Yx(FWY)xxD motif